MAKRINLKKLFNIKIIQLVEPSENLKESYFGKSEKSLLSSKILAENDQIEDSITLSYYSMYNSLLGLLYKCGIKCENHNASIFLLKEIFGIDDSLMKKAKTERINSQYYPDSKTNKEKTFEMINIAEEFNSAIDHFAEKISNPDIESYRNKLKDLAK